MSSNSALIHFINYFSIGSQTAQAFSAVYCSQWVFLWNMSTIRWHWSFMPPVSLFLKKKCVKYFYLKCVLVLWIPLFKISVCHSLNNVINISGRHCGLMVSALGSKLSSPGSSSWLGHCVVFLGWARHFTLLIVALFTQVFNSGQLRGNPVMD